MRTGEATKTAAAAAITAVLFIGLCIGRPGTAGAQVAGQHRGIFVGTGPYLSSLNAVISAIGHVDPRNRFTMTPTVANGPWPHWGTVAHAATEIDNRSVLVVALDGYVGTTSTPLRYGLYRIDPLAPGVTTTLWSAPATAPFPAGIAGTALDSDGDLAGTSSSLGQALRWDRASGAWSGSTLIGAAPSAGLGGLVWDKIDGGFYFANAQRPGNQSLYRLSYDYSQLTPVAQSASTLVVARLGGALLQDGTWVSSDATGLVEYHAVPAGQSTWARGAFTTGLATVDVHAERYSAAGRGYYLARSMLQLGRYVNALAYADASTTPHTVTNIVAPAALPNGVNAYLSTVHPLHDHDLITVRTGKASWELRIEPDPATTIFASRPYVVLASLAPVSRNAPIVLPGQRELFFRFDPLSGLTLSGQTAPFFRDNVGLLDGRGAARAKIDLRRLGVSANGIIVHFAGFVIDPAAPGGIAWVLEPWAFAIDVQP